MLQVSWDKSFLPRVKTNSNARTKSRLACKLNRFRVIFEVVPSRHSFSGKCSNYVLIDIMLHHENNVSWKTNFEQYEIYLTWMYTSFLFFFFFCESGKSPILIKASFSQTRVSSFHIHNNKVNAVQYPRKFKRSSTVKCYCENALFETSLSCTDHYDVMKEILLHFLLFTWNETRRFGLSRKFLEEAASNKRRNTNGEITEDILNEVNNFSENICGKKCTDLFGKRGFVICAQLQYLLQEI